MSNGHARYRHAHQQERERWVPILDPGDAYCADRLCKKRTCWIVPGSKWHLAHDPTGTTDTGVIHEACYTSECAIRGNRIRAQKRRRWQL